MLVNNLRITVNRAHIRVEDNGICYKNRPFAFGI